MAAKISKSKNASQRSLKNYSLISITGSEQIYQMIEHDANSRITNLEKLFMDMQPSRNLHYQLTTAEDDDVKFKIPTYDTSYEVFLALSTFEFHNYSADMLRTSVIF